MPLSEESRSSAFFPTKTRSSIMCLDLLLTSSWREDSKRSFLKRDWPSQSIMQESKSVKDISVLVDKWSTSHPSWFQRFLNHILPTLQPQYSLLEKLVESRERRLVATKAVTNEHYQLSEYHLI